MATLTNPQLICKEKIMPVITELCESGVTIAFADFEEVDDSKNPEFLKYYNSYYYQ